MSKSKSTGKRPRVTSQRHPLLVGRPRGVFYPDAVGVVPNYPKTPEAFEAMCVRLRANWQKAIANNGGKVPPRRGVPDGWANRKPELKRIRETARALAKKVVQAMVEKGLLDDDDLSKGNLAITAALEIVLAVSDKDGSYVYGVKERLQAARLVADFTKSKPAQKVEAKLEKAEDFLALVAADTKSTT